MKKSVTPDVLFSLIDGKPYKTLKRHLGTHCLDPQAYLVDWGGGLVYAAYDTVDAAHVRGALGLMLALDWNEREGLGRFEFAADVCELLRLGAGGLGVGRVGGRLAASSCPRLTAGRRIS